MMPGILVGWRDDWMAWDAGEVVEVVETGLSANSLATRRVVWIFVARRSNHGASIRCYTKVSRPRDLFVPFMDLTSDLSRSEIQHVPSMLQKRPLSLLQKSCSKLSTVPTTPSQRRFNHKALILSNSCKKNEMPAGVALPCG
jgi:hypothetical protein